MHVCLAANRFLPYYQAAVCFENLNFFFMKTANIPVYGTIAVYETIAMYVYKKEYTVRCLEYICSVSSPLRRHGLTLYSRL